MSSKVSNTLQSPVGKTEATCGEITKRFAEPRALRYKEELRSKAVLKMVPRGVNKSYQLETLAIGSVRRQL
jgi:hypothetical protein